MTKESLMRIDAHQHFWQYSPAEYGWINQRMTRLQRDFLPDDLAPLLSEAGLTHSIAVQARQSLEETAWLLSLAEQHETIAGVVGWVDLRSPELGEQLNRFSEHSKFVGVRHVAQDEEDDLFLSRPEVVAGISQLAKFQLTYDILIYPRQLPAAIELVRQLPQQPFVLDHLAKPQIADGLLEPWRQKIHELAQFPNVCCKLSGMVTEAHWQNWTEAQFHLYMETVWEAFGPKRLMCGSDWPVCLLAAEYANVIGLVHNYVMGRDPAAMDDIFGRNAEQFYLTRRAENVSH